MGEKWNTDMGQAPHGTPVEVRVGRRKVFQARLLKDHSLTEDEMPCDQWVAELDAKPPEDWSAGACWSSNWDGVSSTFPNAWRHPQPKDTPNDQVR